MTAKKVFFFLNLICLGVISLFLLWGIKRYYFNRQLLFWIVSLALSFFIFKLKIQLEEGERTFFLLYGVMIFLLLLPLVLGKAIRGSSRWILIRQFSFQPSELIKPIFVISLASFLTKFYRKKRGEIRLLFFSLAILLFPVLLILKQPDLGSGFTLALTGGIMIFFSFPRKKLLLFLGIIFLLFSSFGWRFLLNRYQQARVEFFLHPEKDPLGQGYNLIQTKVAIGSGGIWGRGLALGGQTRLAFLPERHNDFIFAVLGESFGLVGIILVVLLYFLLFWQLSQALFSSENQFIFLVKLGLIFYLWFQTVINMGMNLGIFPITGLPLPFFSYGGSSLLSSIIAVSLIMK